MDSDMVVVLGRATTDGTTVFGHNSTRPEYEVQVLVREPGRTFAAGEVVGTRQVAVPQVRQTCTVLAGRPFELWGYLHGVNEHGVAAGLTAISTRLRGKKPGLEGPELVRLALERSASARQAVDLVTDLIARHGQGAAEGQDSGEAQDSSLLIADGGEAYVLEASGCHWAVQDVKEVRVVSGLCQMRQDWDRISRGLSDLVIERGWSPGDGSKVDFAQAVGRPGPGDAATLRRWGRATLQLEQHNGRIDPALVRRLLSETAPGVPGKLSAEAPGNGLCRIAGEALGAGTAGSLVAQLVPGAEDLPLAWYAYGPPYLSVYFPISLVGEMPQAFADPGPRGLWRRMHQLHGLAREDRQQAQAVRSALTSLQARFDHDAQEFSREAPGLRRNGEHADLDRLAGSLMQSCLERWEETLEGLLGNDRPARPAAVSL